MIRLPVVAGQFYPENKKELGKMIDGFLAEAKPLKIKGEILGLLLPHAGYLYSGQVAACGCKAIFGKDFDTVIILGDSHYERFDGVAVWPEGEWETPLGKIKIDSKLARTVLDSSKRFLRRDSAHLWEHSIEVHLPFLQKILKDFKILPIIFGSEDVDWKLLADVILKNIKRRKALIIASADLSHYLPYKKAKEVDSRTLKNVLDLKFGGLDICAIDSAKTLIAIAKNLKGRAKLLKYSHSGEVGYGAVVFTY